MNRYNQNPNAQCIYIHIHTYIHIYTYIHTCMHIHTHVYIHTHMHIHTQIHIHIYMHIQILIPLFIAKVFRHLQESCEQVTPKMEGFRKSLTVVCHNALTLHATVPY